MCEEDGGNLQVGLPYFTYDDTDGGILPRAPVSPLAGDLDVLAGFPVSVGAMVNEAEDREDREDREDEEGDELVCNDDGDDLERGMDAWVTVPVERCMDVARNASGSKMFIFSGAGRLCRVRRPCSRDNGAAWSDATPQSGTTAICDLSQDPSQDPSHGQSQTSTAKRLVGGTPRGRPRAPVGTAAAAARKKAVSEKAPTLVDVAAARGGYPVIAELPNFNFRMAAPEARHIPRSATLQAAEKTSGTRQYSLVVTTYIGPVRYWPHAAAMLNFSV